MSCAHSCFVMNAAVMSQTNPSHSHQRLIVKHVNHHIRQFTGFIQCLLTPPTSPPPYSHFFLLPYSFLFFFMSSSSSSRPFLLLSAQCKRIYHSLGDPVHSDSGSGVPSLSSPNCCFPSSSIFSSSSSCAQNRAPAIGHCGANHQCSHRPT